MPFIGSRNGYWEALLAFEAFSKNGASTKVALSIKKSRHEKHLSNLELAGMTPGCKRCLHVFCDTRAAQPKPE